MYANELAHRLLSLPADTLVHGTLTYSRAVEETIRCDSDFTPPEREWVPLDTTKAAVPEFYEVQVITAQPLFEEEMGDVFGCIAYAFKQHFRGESAGLPRKTGLYTFEFDYDITKSRSDDWMAHVDDAREAAIEYAYNGTPQRKRSNDRLISAPMVTVDDISVR